MNDENKTALLSKLRAEGVQAGDERATFEVEYAKELCARGTPPTFTAFLRNPDDSYALPIVERAWAMWQARAALASAPVAGEAQPFAVLAVHKNGEIRSYSTGQALMDAPIQDAERELQRKYGYELVTVYAAPQASEAVCSCPTGDGSLRHPCAVHPQASEAVRDAAFEAVRKRLCAIPRYSFYLDDDGVVRRVEGRSGNWIEFDAVHALFDPVSVDAALSPTQPTEQGERDE